MSTNPTPIVVDIPGLRSLNLQPVQKKDGTGHWYSLRKAGKALRGARIDANDAGSDLPTEFVVNGKTFATTLGLTKPQNGKTPQPKVYVSKAVEHDGGNYRVFVQVSRLTDDAVYVMAKATRSSGGFATPSVDDLD